MASKFVLVVNTNNDAATTASEIASNVASNGFSTGASAGGTITNIAAFIQTQVLGRGINVIYADTCVAATATVTFTGRPVAAETMSIANITFTARDSGASGNEFNTDASSVTVTATNLAAAINASANLTGICSATSALGVVTISANPPGTCGNGLQISESMTNTAATAFTGGAQSHGAVLSSGL